MIKSHWFSLIACILILLFLIGCQAESTGSTADGSITYFPVKPESELSFSQVERVVDGDTIVIGEERIRLLLIDTPETVHPQRPVEPFGPEASDYTKKMIEGKRVGLEFDVAERDRYGRLLAYVWVETSPNHFDMLNALLIQEGLAQVSVYQPNVRHVDILRELQKEAEQNQLGIWSIEREAGLEAKGEETKEEVDLSQAMYVASKNSNVYHELHCPGGADKIKAENAIYFASEEEAIQSGRRMCQSASCPAHY